MTRLITGKTKILGIAGDPVEHSISPVFQNWLIEKYNIDYIYVPFHIKNYPDINSYFRMLFNFGITGINVTIPYKELAYKISDKIDRLSEFTGAVNTLYFKNNTLYGYNTDGPGYWHSLENSFKIDYGKTTLTVLGNGGAAKGIIGEGIIRGITQITIIARNREKSNQFINKINNNSVNIKHVDWENISMVRQDKNKSNIIINTTSIGMNGESLDFNWQNWDKSAIFSDIVYNQGKTPWLQKAEKKGYRIHEGYLMLAGQGIISFEIWTGIKPEFSEVAEFVKETLYGSSSSGK